MAIRPIVKYGNLILRRKTKSVDDFSQITSLTKDMFDTMYQEDGIGLAANQVDVDCSLAVVDVSHTDESDTPLVFVNGEITERWGEVVMEEGCLSLPGIRVDVTRSERIRFSYQDLSGNAHEKEFEGLLARVIQHEIDHLNGMMIIDRAGSLSRQRYKKQLKEIASASSRVHSDETSS